MFTIYHNPSCGTSRNVLAHLQGTGQPVSVVEYLKTGWTAPQLRALFAAAGITPRQALRKPKEGGEALGGLSGSALIEAMVADPRLVNRPFVVAPRGTRLCRPSETVRALID